MVGLTIKHALCSIILRFRMHRIAFTADIDKTYRQVLVAHDDSSYQRILWRSDRSAPLQEYQLKTFTYGMTCAPFPAVRCLLQLAHEEGERIEAANILYDCISGCDNAVAAINAQQDLKKLLKKHGFSLRKWCSNSADVLENIPSEL
ncbi:uncharacterized protein LOC126249244 [Schistocerca nitens]|uniref:uncharacterized protein LOC126249244 n=1 Tax=Schistocerca nitens TaxID=7011 RepID=UPI00211979C2|nr:uncharacterized protein LOC126249244 [Schistocerca nitens]